MRGTTGFSVIVVDDHPLVRSAVSRGLAQLGHRVRTATNGEEALELMKEGYDAVLSDVDMPVLDGYGMLVTAESRGHDPSRIVFMSGSESEVVRMLQERGRSVLRKPVEIRALSEAIGQAAQVRA